MQSNHVRAFWSLPVSYLAEFWPERERTCVKLVLEHGERSLDPNRCGLVAKYPILSVVALVGVITQSSFAQALESGNYYIQNVVTGLVLDVAGGNRAEGTIVRPHALNHTASQEFRIRKIDAVDSEFAIYPQVSRQMRLTAKSTPLKNRGKVRDQRTGAGSTGSARERFKQKKFENASAGSNASRNPANRTTAAGTYQLSIEREKVGAAGVELSIANKFHQDWHIAAMDSSSFRIASSGLGRNMVLLPESASPGAKLVFKSSANANLVRWRIVSTEPEPPQLQQITLADVDIETPSIVKVWKDDKLVIRLRWVDSDAESYSVWLVNNDGTDTNLQSNLAGTAREYTHSEKRVVAGGIPKRCFRIVKKNSWNNSRSSEHQCFEASIQKPSSKGS